MDIPDRCQYNGCKNLRQNPSNQDVENYNLALCPNHTSTLRYTDLKNRHAWIENNIVRINMGVCASCEKEKVLGQDDYLCSQCRLDLGPKWTLTFERTSKRGMTPEDIEELLPVLIKQEVSFRLSVESA